MDMVYRDMLGMTLMAVMVIVVIGVGTVLAYLTGERVTASKPDQEPTDDTRNEAQSDDQHDDDQRADAARTPAAARD